MGLINRLAHIHNPVEKTNRATREITDKVNEILGASPILDGRLITGQELEDNTLTKINHKLDRKIRGWFVVDLIDTVTTGRIERATSETVGGVVTTPNDTQQIWLEANGYGATITVSLWVF